MNPYESPNQTSMHSIAPGRRLTRLDITLAVIVPIAVSAISYSLFRPIASQLNVGTWHSTDNFYYSVATATWPIFAFLVAGCIALVAKRRSFPLYLTIPMFILGLISMVFVGETDRLIGYRDSGRNGLFEYSSNVDGWSTPKLSASLILPVYGVTFVGVKMIRRRKTCDN